MSEQMDLEHFRNLSFQTKRRVRVRVRRDKAAQFRARVQALLDAYGSAVPVKHQAKRSKNHET